MAFFGTEDDLEGEEINWEPKGANGWGPLHLAAAHGDIKRLVQLLDILNPGNLDDSRGEGRPYMHRRSYSARQKRPAVPGRSLESVSATGDRAFHVALRNGQVLAARELARAGCDVNARGKGGQTAAHICAACDLAEELGWLIKHAQVDPCALTDKGESIAHFAARNCRINFLEWLRTQPFGSYELFSTPDKAGYNIVHDIARGGRQVVVTWVLGYLNAAERRKGEIEVISLFNAGPKGRDPIAVAKADGHFMIAEMLLDYRNKKSRERRTRKQACKALSDAAQRGDIKSVKNLMRKHGKKYNLLDQPNVKGRTALLEAASAGAEPLVAWLLAQPGKRKLVDSSSSESVLHAAVRSGNAGLVHFLLSKSFIDPSHQDADGLTPRDLAHKLGKDDCVRAFDDVCDDSARVAPEQSQSQASDETRSPTSARSAAYGGGSNESLVDEEEDEDDVPLSFSVNKSQKIAARKQAEKRRLLDWLSELDMLEWFDKLCEEGFDSLSRLEHIEEGDLVDWGMKKGYRRSFLRSVSEMSGLNSSTNSIPFMRATSSSSGATELSSAASLARNSLASSSHKASTSGDSEDDAADDYSMGVLKDGQEKGREEEKRKKGKKETKKERNKERKVKT